MRKEIVCIVMLGILGQSISQQAPSEKIVNCLNNWVDFNIGEYPICNIWELSALESTIAPQMEGFSSIKEGCQDIKDLVDKKGGECLKQFNQITGSISTAPITIMGNFKWVKPEDIYNPIKEAIAKLKLIC